MFDEPAGLGTKAYGLDWFMQQLQKRFPEVDAFGALVEPKYMDCIDALISDANRYRHRRSMTVTNRLSLQGVMAISPELLTKEYDVYDAQTDSLKPIQMDMD